MLRGESPVIFREYARREVHLLSHALPKTVEGLILMPRRRRAKLRILECVARAEGKPEGELLRKLMRILEIRLSFKRIYGKESLLKQLENAKEPYIHISAHGDHSRKIGTYIETSKGRVSVEDVE